MTWPVPLTSSFLARGAQTCVGSQAVTQPPPILDSDMPALPPTCEAHTNPSGRPLPPASRRETEAWTALPLFPSGKVE